MRFHFRWAATALFVVAAVRVPAAIRLFSGDQLGLIGMARRKAVLENYITKTTSRMNIVITLLLSLFAIWTNSVAAALIFSNTHSYQFRGDPAAIVIDVEVHDNYFGNYSKYFWQYKVTNNSYNPNPGLSNGFSGFETALPAGVPDLADLVAPNSNWIFDCCSGQPVEWDIRNSAGNGVMPGEVGIFSFTSRPRFITQSAGWFHTWEFNSQTNIVNYPPGNGVEVPDVLITTAQLDQVTAVGNAVTVSVGASPTGSAPVTIETEVEQGNTTQTQHQTIAVGDSTQQVFSGLQNNVPSTVSTYVLDSLGNRAFTAGVITATPTPPPSQAINLSSGSPPILLIHGYDSGASTWTNTFTALKNANFKVSAYSYSTVSGSNVCNQVLELKNEIQRVKQQEGVSQVILIGHSQGGIVARLYMQAGQDPTRFIEALTPYRNTGSAGLSNAYFICEEDLYDEAKFFDKDHSDVAGLITYGTPHNGAHGLFIAVLNALLHEGSGFLTVLNDFAQFPLPPGLLMTNIVGKTGPFASDDCLVSTDSQNITKVGYSGPVVVQPQSWRKHGTSGNFGCLSAIGRVAEVEDSSSILEALKAQVLTISLHSPADIVVTDPIGRIVSKSARGIWGATYVEVPDDAGVLHDEVTIPFPEHGQYQIQVIPDANASPTATFGVSTEIDGQETILVENVPISAAISNPFILTISVGNRQPQANAGADQIVECTGSGGRNVTLNGLSSSDPDGDPLTFSWDGPFGTASGPTPTVTLPKGINTITLTVSDGRGGSSSAVVIVNVVDTTPPVINAVTATPNLLWPPNHKMIPVAVSVSATDACSETTTCKILSVTSNELINGTGDGDMAPDWKITGNLKADIRAERAGSGSGRTYSLAVQCTDESGNSSIKDVTVNVPHN